MKWHFLNARECFQGVRKDWDALNQLRGNHILLDSRFVVTLIKHFGTRDTRLALSIDGSKQGMALLEKTTMGRWCTFQPSQAPLGLILFDSDDQEFEGLFALMRSLPRYVAILSVLRQDPFYTVFGKASDNPSIEIVNYAETPRLVLSGDFQQYWADRSKNLKHNLERQSRRAREQGNTLELVTERQPARMADCIREYGCIESAGWKGEEGSAIEENNIQGRFYRDLFETFAATGEAIVYRLLLNGKVVASDLCLCRDGMLVVLKTTYDEKIEKLYLALLMRREIIRQLYSAHDALTVEFYGRLLAWHTQWMTDARPMFHVNVFRNIYLVRTRTLLNQVRRAMVRTA